jgi:hypothetical protein
MRSSDSVQPLLEPGCRSHFECLLVLDMEEEEMEGCSTSLTMRWEP